MAKTYFVRMYQRITWIDSETFICTPNLPRKQAEVAAELFALLGVAETELCEVDESGHVHVLATHTSPQGHFAGEELLHGTPTNESAASVAHSSAVAHAWRAKADAWGEKLQAVNQSNMPRYRRMIGDEAFKLLERTGQL